MKIGARRRVEVSQWICIIAGSRLVGGRFGACLCLTYESTLTRASPALEGRNGRRAQGTRTAQSTGRAQGTRTSHGTGTPQGPNYKSAGLEQRERRCFRLSLSPPLGPRALDVWVLRSSCAVRGSRVVRGSVVSCVVPSCPAQFGRAPFGRCALTALRSLQRLRFLPRRALTRRTRTREFRFPPRTGGRCDSQHLSPLRCRTPRPSRRSRHP